MKVLAVLSGKGGVGKTTTVSNLSAALTTEFGRNVVGVDGNVTTPNLGLHLGTFSFQHTLNDVLGGAVPLREAIYTCPNGVRLIPAQLSFDAGNVDLSKMRDSLNELDADLVLIDSCPGLGNEIVPTLKITDEALIVTNPEIPAITDALRAIEMARRYNVLVKGVILNRVRNDKYELSVAEVKSVFDVPIISVIPEDPCVREGIFLGDPVVVAKPFSPAAIEFKRLAGYLVDEEYSASFIDRIKWFFDKIFGKSKSRWRVQEVPVPMPAAGYVDTSIPLENEELPEKPPEESPAKNWEELLEKPQEALPEKKLPEKPAKEHKKPSKPKSPENDKLESKLASLMIKKDVIEASLEALEKKFHDGQVDEGLYVKLTDKYIYELDSHKTEIARAESGSGK